MSLKVFFSIFSSDSHFVQPSETILAYLVEGHTKNTFMKLSENWSIGLGIDSILSLFSIFSSGTHLVYLNGKVLSILVGSQLCIIPVKSELNWTKGLGEDSIYNKLFMLFYYKL